jgi:hypothetical protein
LWQEAATRSICHSLRTSVQLRYFGAMDGHSDTYGSDSIAWSTRQDERAMTWYEATVMAGPLAGYQLWCQGDARGEVWRFGFVAGPATNGWRSGSTIIWSTEPAVAKNQLLALALAHAATLANSSKSR